jgi:hypothetical protein
VRGLLTIIAFAVLVTLLIPANGNAEEKPIQLSLFTPVQIYPESDDITAFRFNLIYGRNASITGIDLGLVNHTTAGMSSALQIGVVSLNDADFTGVQYSTVNVTRQSFKGFQWGLVNYAGSGNGFQLGFFNYAEKMHGLQIGLINVIREGGVLPVLPIVNWSF